MGIDFDLIEKFMLRYLLSCYVEEKKNYQGKFHVAEPTGFLVDVLNMFIVVFKRTDRMGEQVFGVDFHSHSHIFS